VSYGNLRKPIPLDMVGQAKTLTGKKKMPSSLLIRHLGDLVSVSGRRGR
jgi:hypothetical protein